MKHNACCDWRPWVNPIKLFLHKMKNFFPFSLLNLSVCSIRKYCLYFKMAKQKSEKRRNQRLVGLTLNVWKVKASFSLFNNNFFECEKEEKWRVTFLQTCVKEQTRAWLDTKTQTQKQTQIKWERESERWRDEGRKIERDDKREKGRGCGRERERNSCKHFTLEIEGKRKQTNCWCVKVGRQRSVLENVCVCVCVSA